MSKTIEITSDNFQKEVIESEIPILIDFWAPWCQPCLMMAPALEELADSLKGKVKIAKVNTEIPENQQLAVQYQIQSIPNMKLFKNGQVVKEFIGNISEKAVGQQVLRSLQPGQQVIKVVHEELISLLGESACSINMAETQPTVIMVVGLSREVEKTTTSAKLAKYFTKQNYQCSLTAADIYRPAAVKQLEVLGSQLNIPVFSGPNDPVKIATDSVKLGSRENKDIVIIDTAGRLHIDEKLMKELVDIKKATKAHEVLFVADAMTGQDTVK